MAGYREERTGVVKNSLNPTYDWSCVVSYKTVEAALANSMRVEAWDEDLLTPDFLGRGLLRLEEHRNAIEAGKPVEIAVPLVYKPMMGKEKEAGQVFFTITWESRGGS